MAISEPNPKPDLREQLIAQGLCIGCQRKPVSKGNLFCKLCHGNRCRADARAMIGLHKAFSKERT